MKLFVWLALAAMLFAAPALADHHGHETQNAALDASMAALSLSTSTAGDGPEAYRAILHPDFNRWTMGSNLVNDRDMWINSMHGWWDDGWRVESSDITIHDIRWANGFAFVRRSADEVYRGPDGDHSTASATLAEVWRETDDGWRLWQVNVQPQ